MTEESPTTRQPSNSYQIFIFVLTILSLLVMLWQILPVSAETKKLLTTYDNLICVIFLIDFYLNMRGARKKSDYFIKERGWLDLMGSIPTLGFTTYGGLLRLARLSRLARITRLMRGQNKKELVDDIIKNRNQYTAFITILLTLIVLTVASVLVLQFESKSPDANIKSGWDSFWYAVVTITTVGYGDRFPVTPAGRITAMFIMFMGVGIIGALASILSSILVGAPSTPAEEKEPTAPQGELSPVDLAGSPATKQDVANLQSELVALRQMLEKMSGTDGHKLPLEIKE
jgi:voltage-gated potassium channel